MKRRREIECRRISFSTKKSTEQGFMSCPKCIIEEESVFYCTDLTQKEEMKNLFLMERLIEKLRA